MMIKQISLFIVHIVDMSFLTSSYVAQSRVNIKACILLFNNIKSETFILAFHNVWGRALNL